MEWLSSYETPGIDALFRDYWMLTEISALFCNSVYKSESILEIYNDAHTFGLKSANSTAVSNSNLAIFWLEATFPELVHQAMEGENLSMLKAQPYALFDASLSLQVFSLK